MSRLLIVEDDPALRRGLRDAFESEGYEVVTAADGSEAARVVFDRHFDAIVLDLMLPGRGGLEVLREIRAQALRVPVLILTARGDESDRVLGLDLGADDYVTKPFSLRELTARMRALLRRVETRRAAEEAHVPDRVKIGDATVNLAAYEIVRPGDLHRLSPKEVAMLKLLIAREGRAVSRGDFLDLVWPGDADVGPRTIDTHMLNLRQKIEIDPKKPTHLVTVHGVGYRLVME
ncbi:MAG: response regulator transcription factor [Planctomycetota bacterium]